MCLLRGLRPTNYFPYWVLVALFVLQTIAVCFTHCLAARLALCDTVLVVVALASKGFVCDEKAPSVLRSSALIAFEGLLFVNLTHAVQMLIERHDEGVHLKGIYIGLTLLDMLVKFIMMVSGVLPRLYMGVFSRILLHFSATSATLLVALLDYLKHEERVVLMADPIFTILTSIILSAVAFPSFRLSTPFLFGDLPSDFRAEDFKADISAKFSAVQCDHLHVYKRWPGNAFDAFLVITLFCSKSDEDWQSKAQAEVMQIQKEIRSVLTKAGAYRITVQPNVVDESLRSDWQRCVRTDCVSKWCCSPKHKLCTSDLTNGTA